MVTKKHENIGKRVAGGSSCKSDRGKKDKREQTEGFREEKRGPLFISVKGLMWPDIKSPLGIKLMPRGTSLLAQTFC